MIRALQHFFRILLHDEKKKHQNGAEGQERQRHYIIQKLNFLLLKVPLRRLPSSKVVFFLCHVTVFSKGPIN